jgi:outer membrane receptor protein involved in Fe transport
MFYTLHHEILEPNDGLREISPGSHHTNRMRRPSIRLLVTLGVTRAIALAIIASGVTSTLAQIEGPAIEDADSADELDAGETDPGDETFRGVEEMTVEARRRSENLQKVGESVSSFSSTDILERGITNFNDLQYSVPSLFSDGGLTRLRFAVLAAK